MAMVVIGLSVLALLGGIIWSITAVNLTRENDFATQILTERMETIRLYSLSQLTNNGFLPNRVTIPDPKNTNRTYTLAISLTNNFLAANYASNLTQVTLDLRWSTGLLQRQRTQRTFVANNGLQSYVN